MQFVCCKENAKDRTLVIRHSSSIDIAVSARHLEGITFPLFDVLDGEDVVVAVDEDCWFFHIPSETCKHKRVLSLSSFDQIDLESSPFDCLKDVRDVVCLSKKKREERSQTFGRENRGTLHLSSTRIACLDQSSLSGSKQTFEGDP